MVLGKDTFLRYDLAITRDQHHHNIVNGKYFVQANGDEPVLHVRREDVPTYDDLKTLLERVGGPYGWDRRKEYHDEANLKKIEDKLRKQTSAHYSFWAGNEVVGGAIVANIEEGLSKIFRLAKEKGSLIIDPAMANKSIEIYKIGLFPEHTNKGWGRYFLSDMLKNLFNSSQKPEVVYLNTRSTNHDGVLKFYMQFNMNVIHAQSFPDDLVGNDELPSPRGTSSRISPSQPTSAVA